MLIIGVTGGMGTGKTTVARIFERLGAVSLDADEIAHRLIEPKTKAYSEVVNYFGNEVLNRDKTINRKALAKQAFSSKRRLKKLCEIIHPLVYKEIEGRLKKIKKLKPKAIVVLDVPLLLESGGRSKVDKLVVVKSKREVQLKRAAKNLGLSRPQILKRIKAQMPLRKKINAADFVIDNNGTPKATRKQVSDIWKMLARM